ncbi:hypothetical protein JQX13_28520 [Archangium violaceum]|uniref:hypothetical protein n=1 Tax=Archangium violaceum TaxID=83451 RepID=UPI00193B2BBD|nr:hypothetical protein [Archangium violaceum]QRK04213.1 hypothetical protein JQX13_28520 [Archangium violaceum]
MSSRKWSGFYNDGLGLNACTWNCSATTAGGAVYATTSFRTGWGQNIMLKALRGGQLVMR